MGLERLEISSTAEHVARALLDGDYPRCNVEVHLPNESSVAGKSFVYDRVEIIVTENFIFAPKRENHQTTAIIFRLPYSDN